MSSLKALFLEHVNLLLIKKQKLNEQENNIIYFLNSNTILFLFFLFSVLFGISFIIGDHSKTKNETTKGRKKKKYPQKS